MMNKSKKGENFKEITDLPGGAKNNIVYIVKIIDEDSKIKYFISSKVDITSAMVKFIGYETTKTSANKIKTYSDAISIANKNKVHLVDMIYTLHRIISVQNVTYRQA